MATAWAERTPPGFVFHVKAFAMMTRHPVKVEQLPPDLRSEAEFDERGRVDHPSQQLRAEVFRRFCRAVEPLRDAGKLGGVLMQLPPYVVLQAGVAGLPGVGARAAARRAHAGRVSPPQLAHGRHREQTLAFLERCRPPT